VNLFEDLYANLRREAAFAELSDEALDWLLDPVEQATKMVDCPMHGAGCACGSDERTRLALEAYPEAGEEFRRRLKVLGVIDQNG
jgi:hypothetical protein